ncbi:FMN-dependent NADH-azoreductase [Hahella sp. SMD15-11]|uniref:FMN dependent NADH:quinone oxidoreductase n=1 Tax=Thermohahella caldifontis TaxID=3142973 RepID=A0AB39USG5_9GAMM
MKNVLFIHSSPMLEQSSSRELAAHFRSRLLEARPDAQVTERDLVRHPLPHIDQAMIASYYTAPEQRSAEQKEVIATSEALVDELLAADTVVISTPMHNFTIPSGLKAWIDHVARVGRTFKYTENGPVGLAQGKKVFVLAASGGDYREGSAAAAMNHLDPYLKTILGFLGMTDVTFIHAWGMASGSAGLDAAKAEIDALFTKA